MHYVVWLYRKIISVSGKSKIQFLSARLIKELKEDRAFCFNELNEVFLQVAEVVVPGVCVLAKNFKHLFNAFESFTINSHLERCLLFQILYDYIRNHVETLP